MYVDSVSGSSVYNDHNSICQEFDLILLGFIHRPPPTGSDFCLGHFDSWNGKSVTESKELGTWGKKYKLSYKNILVNYYLS